MAEPQVLIPVAPTDRFELAWLERFIGSLRGLGFRVVVSILQETERRTPEEAEATLRLHLAESDIIVFLLDASNVTSPTFYFELGAAASLDKQLFAVLFEDVDPPLLPLWRPHLRLIRKESPERTAERFAGMAMERLTA